MKVRARREKDGSVNLVNKDDYFLQVLTAAENDIKPRTNEEVEEIVRGCGFEIVEWLEVNDV